LISWSELQSWQSDWLDIHPRAIERRRRFIERRSLMEKWRFVTAIQNVRDGHAKLIDDYAYFFADQIEPDSSVATTPDLERLLALAVREGSDGRPDPQRWFEALSFFDQAIAIARIEREDPIECLGRDLDILIDFLSDHFFVDGFESIELHSYHSPERKFCVGPDDIVFGKSGDRAGMVHRKVRLTCRKTDRHKPVFIRDRIKNPFVTWLKTQRQIVEARVQDPFDVKDRCGLMYVLPTVGELYDFAEDLAGLLTQNHAEVIEPFHSNHETDTSADARNPSSSSNHKLAKTLIRWNDRLYEFQFMTFYDYVTSIRSISNANHVHYRLRQAARHFFPLLWPTQLYGVDWADAFATMLRWKEDQLGWRPT